MHTTASLTLAAALIAAASVPAPAAAPDAGKKKIVLIAGKDSHGFGAHAHTAGMLYFAKCLNQSGLPVEAIAVTGGWPAYDRVLDGAAAVVIYCDGGPRHIANPKIKELGALAEKGVGIGMIHYGVETVKGEPGDAFLKWIGGYFEINWSVNPHWTATFTAIGDHPVARNVKPFTLSDEWYYHMRFRDKMEGVTPILSALPPESTLTRKDGPHDNNPAVREAVLQRKEPQHLFWVSTRKIDGGKEQRGFGVTGGHFHVNWANDNLRTALLNAIVWIAGVDVPATGVPSRRPTADDLLGDAKVPANFDKAAMQKKIDEVNQQK